MSKVNVRLQYSENSLSELFHCNTKLYPYHFRQYSYPVLPLKEHPDIAEWMKSPFKEYLSLPRQPLLNPCSLQSGSEKTNPFCLEDISLLLYPFSKTSFLETYLCILNVRGIKEGVYHYNAKSHCLECLLEGDISPNIRIMKNEMLNNFDAIIMISGVFPRAILQYGERGYRYVLFQTGEWIQSIRSTAVRLRTSLCLMPEFYDDIANALLGLDGVEESVLYLVGFRNRI